MLFDTYVPIIYDVSATKNKKKVLDYDVDPVFTNNIALPKINLGYHHKMFGTKDKMKTLNQFKNSKKIYLVTSLFEKDIDKREESIRLSLDEFISTNISEKLPPVLTRAFLKLWEIIVNFDLIHNKNDFVSAHLAEGPGSFIQATILYRDYLAKTQKTKSSNDRYYAVTLHSINEYLLLEKQFIDFYNKEKPKRLHILETVPTKEIHDMYGGGNNEENINPFKTDGDITRLTTIRLFGGNNRTKGFAEKSDFITADGGFEWKNECLQEQESFALIFGQIVTALKVQKINGSFVLKIFETFTLVTLNFIEILRDYYENVYVVKPYTSRASNAEKYIVCKDFKGITQKEITKLESLVTEFEKNKEYNLTSLFPDYTINEKDLKYYVKMNNHLALTHYEAMCKFLNFLNLDNKNGIEYNKYLELQIEASKLWTKQFLTPDLISQNNQIITKYFIPKDQKKIEEPKSEVKEEKQVTTTETTEQTTEDTTEVKEEKPKVKKSKIKPKKK